MEKQEEKQITEAELKLIPSHMIKWKQLCDTVHRSNPTNRLLCDVTQNLAKQVGQTPPIFDQKLLESLEMEADLRKALWEHILCHYELTDSGVARLKSMRQLKDKPADDVHNSWIHDPVKFVQNVKRFLP